jgi:hypothetical protein
MKAADIGFGARCSRTFHFTTRFNRKSQIQNRYIPNLFNNSCANNSYAAVAGLYGS